MPKKTSISFGLVGVPVKMTPCVKLSRVGFNLIDKNSGTRISYKKFNANGEKVENDDIVKGYEYQKNKYVVIEPEELEKLKSPRDSDLEVIAFVEDKSIDPIYFVKSYYLVPDGGKKAYALLCAALEHTGKAAVCKTVLADKETPMCIRAEDGVLTACVMAFGSEVAEPPYRAELDCDQKELNLAVQIVESLSGSFDPDALVDEYKERVLEFVSTKSKGEQFEYIPSAETSRPESLMEALLKSVENLSAAPKQRSKTNGLKLTAARKKTVTTDAKSGAKKIRHDRSRISAPQS